MEDANNKDNIVARMMALIEQCGGDANTQKVECFFYSRDIAWAHVLAGQLRSLNCEVEVSPGPSYANTYLILACTTSVPLETEQIEQWSNQMSALAAQCSCTFDGWGTVVG